jgi:hypothetical protein
MNAQEAKSIQKNSTLTRIENLIKEAAERNDSFLDLFKNDKIIYQVLVASFGRIERGIDVLVPTVEVTDQILDYLSKEGGFQVTQLCPIMYEKQFTYLKSLTEKKTFFFKKPVYPLAASALEKANNLKPVYRISW